MDQSLPPPVSGRISVVAIVCLAALILPLSFSGGAVATPAIGRDLGGDAAALTWITNAFMLTFGSLLMTAGALADRFGRKMVFTGGVALFVAFSLALSFAPSIVAIDVLRAAQGIGAAGALAGGSSVMAQEFQGRRRALAFSMLGTTFGLGLALGPVIAGLLIDAFGWRSIFLTSTGIGALSLLLALPALRETRDPDATRLDLPGALSFTATLSLFTFAVIEGPGRGWGDARVLALFAGAALMFGAFICIEVRATRPMLDLSLFRYPRFLGVQLLPVATCYSYVVLLILLPLRFIGIEGMSEVEAGWLMTALSAPMLVVPSLAATATRWISAGLMSAIGLAAASVGLVWLGSVPSGAGLGFVPPMLVIGLGAGVPWGLMDGLAVSVVPKERAGMAAGIFNTSRVAGEGIALAGVSAALATLTALGAGILAPDLPPAQLAEIAQRLAAGDLAHALAAAPGVPAAQLVASYSRAFAGLAGGLAVITLLSAFAIYMFLRQTAPATREPGGASEATIAG
ncbi:MFS transporter [Roseixanthobacter liquoris]|uniref:MFS transporter n=1 Tax=Roseixanthobacter liquoris TaxID=3119921 RepID=UPI00372B26E7